MGVQRIRTLVLLVIALDLADGHAYGQRPRDDAGKITLAVVQPKSATIKHDYECKVYGQRHVEVRAPADGSLVEVTAGAGQSVKKGDPLFQIRPPADAEKSRADDPNQAASAGAGLEVTGFDAIFRDWPSEREEKPKADNRDGVIAIRAPRDGVIERVTLRPGRLVRKDDLLTRVVDTRVIWAHFRVPERDFLDSAAEWSRNEPNRRIKLTLADGGEFPHAGQSCEPQAGSNSEPGIRFLSKFPNPDGLLRSGRSGTVSVSREWQDAILIPRRATFRTDSEWPRYVYVVDKEHVAHRRRIDTGDGTKDLVAVTKGVGAGDTIVVDGVGEVRDGDKVD